MIRFKNKELEYRVKRFIDFSLALIFLGAILVGAHSCFLTPVVYWSTSKDKCVKVMYHDIELDCSELPKKYNRIWVE